MRVLLIWGEKEGRGCRSVCCYIWFESISVWGLCLLLGKLVLIHGRSTALGLLDGACAGQLRTAGVHELVPRPLPDAGSVSCGG